MAAELKAQERISLPRQDILPEPQANHGPTGSPPEVPEASRACPGPGGDPISWGGHPGPLTLAHAYPALTRPFPVHLVEVKPRSLNQEKTRALALAYVDMRAYQARLDEVVGPDGWSVRYRTLGDRAVICRLTVLGISREDVGEADPEACPGPRSGNVNAWTSAVAQSFKRACASFGLGRYLYSLPRLWAEYDPQKKALKTPQKIVERMYKEARL